MEIIQIVAFALIAAFLATVLREYNPFYAALVAVVAGVIIFLRVTFYLSAVLGYLTEISAQADVSPVYLGLLLKIVGIAYLVEFAAQICRDTGEGICPESGVCRQTADSCDVHALLSAVLETILKFVP